MSSFVERLFWILNGLLVIVYSSADRLLALLLLASLAAFVWFSPNEQRGWSIGMAALAFAAGVVAPAPVPAALLMMSIISWVALTLEKYNRSALRWSTIKGISIYALAGLGYAAYKGLELGASFAADPQMAQGAVYLNTLIGIGMYVGPFGFVAMLAQAIWAHPPIPGGSPENIIGTIRSRGKN